MAGCDDDLQNSRSKQTQSIFPSALPTLRRNTSTTEPDLSQRQMQPGLRLTRASQKIAKLNENPSKIVVEWFWRGTLLNLRGCRHPHSRQPDCRQIRVVAFGF